MKKDKFQITSKADRECNKLPADSKLLKAIDKYLKSSNDVRGTNYNILTKEGI